MIPIANLPNRLKALRKQRKVTQKELANALGLAYSTISMYEKGSREPDLRTLEAIADYFEVDMNYLIGSQTQPRPISNEELKFALFGGDGHITDDMFEDVKRYALFLKEKNKL